MTYNGYTNWETSITMMAYDETLYDVAREYKREGMSKEEFKERVEEIIYDDCNDDTKYPEDYTLVGEFVKASLGEVNFNEIADLIWNEIVKEGA